MKNRRWTTQEPSKATEEFLLCAAGDAEVDQILGTVLWYGYTVVDAWRHCCANGATYWLIRIPEDSKYNLQVATRSQRWSSCALRKEFIKTFLAKTTRADECGAEESLKWSTCPSIVVVSPYLRALYRRQNRFLWPIDIHYLQRCKSSISTGASASSSTWKRRRVEPARKSTTDQTRTDQYVRDAAKTKPPAPPATLSTTVVGKMNLFHKDSYVDTNVLGRKNGKATGTERKTADYAWCTFDASLTVLYSEPISLSNSARSSCIFLEPPGRDSVSLSRALDEFSRGDRTCLW